MEKLRVKDIQEIARSQGLKGWSGLKKSDLISFIKVRKRSPLGKPNQAQAKTLLEKHLHKQLIRQRMINENLLQKQRKEHERRKQREERRQMLKEEQEQRMIRDLISAEFMVGYLGIGLGR